MDINQLEVLIAVAREKSFSRAADVLGRTQPAVSQAIRRLELEIGEKLFDRSSKDGTLTTSGEVLVDYARQMLNLRQAANTALREMKSLQNGKVTISASARPCRSSSSSGAARTRNERDESSKGECGTRCPMQ